VILIFQKLRARADDDDRILAALRTRAAAMLRNRRADAVLVCQRADLPRHLLWIQHHAGPHGLAAGRESPSLEAGLVEPDGGPARVEFVDGSYHFPLPPCRVWGIEACHEKAGGPLMQVSRAAAADGRICGVSVYRMVEDPSRLIGFLALASPVTPGDCLPLATWREDTDLSLYPLRVSWTIGRLASETTSSPPVVRYPRAAFWARLGPVSGVGDDCGSGGADHGSEWRVAGPGAPLAGSSTSSRADDAATRGS
jgi:hypothetical protein